MQPEKITEVATLTPGVVFIEVEAYGDGPWFSVGVPLVVVKEPPTKTAQWPVGSRWSVWVRKLEDGDKATNLFPLALPSRDGVAITREQSDYSAFFIYALELEQKLRGLKSLEEYRAFAGI